MTIAQLEANLAAKRRELATLLDNTLRAAQAEVVRPATATEPAVVGRPLNPQENAALDALMAEARGLNEQIERARGDADRLSAIQQMTQGLALQPRTPTSTPRDRRPIGVQFTSSTEWQSFLTAGLHHRTGSWTSPALEAAHWRDLEYMAATLSEDPASGGALVPPQYLPGVLPLPMRRPVVGDLPAPGTALGNLISYMKETLFTNAAAAVKEGTAKPESELVFGSATAPVRKIAHWIPVTEEILEDAPATASIIDARLRWGVEVKEEDELLNGGGVDPHILGYNKLPGLAPAVPMGTDTPADAILRQITAIAIASLVMPDAWVMNPSDWFLIATVKNAQGNYMGSGPWSAPQTPMLWGLPGVLTPVEPVGESLVGGFRSSSQVFRKGGIRVEATNSHQDFFVKNLIAIRAEERLALAVYREAAFGKVTGIAAPVVP